MVSSDNTIRIWSLESGKCERIFEGHNSAVTSICISKDQKYLYSCSKDKTIRIWSLESGKCELLLGKYPLNSKEMKINKQTLIDQNDLELLKQLGAKQSDLE